MALTAAQYEQQSLTAGGAASAIPLKGSLVPPQISAGTDAFTGPPERSGTVYTEVTSGGTTASPEFIEHWVTFNANPPPNGPVPSFGSTVTKLSGAPIVWATVVTQLASSLKRVWHAPAKYQYKTPPTMAAITAMGPPDPALIQHIATFTVYVVPNASAKFAAGGLLREKIIANNTYIDTWILGPNYAMPSTANATELAPVAGAAAPKNVKAFLLANAVYLSGSYVAVSYMMAELPSVANPNP